MEKLKRKVFSWINDNLSARDTVKYGKGVFANNKIEKGELLLVFGGYVMTRGEEDALPEKIRDIAIRITPNHVIGVIDEDQLAETEFVNHSCEPNAGIKGQISLVAMRDIEVDEEITFDYGTVLFDLKGGPAYELDCFCGKKNCRGKITQNDWRLPALQKKYKGFFPYYIEEKINEVTN